MTKRNFIPKWLLPILFSIFLISLISYYLISKSPRIEDLFINLAATILGILLTLFVIIGPSKISFERYNNISAIRPNDCLLAIDESLCKCPWVVLQYQFSIRFANARLLLIIFLKMEIGLYLYLALAVPIKPQDYWYQIIRFQVIIEVLY